MKTKIISVLNLKGGVGKTTTTLNLGKALANKGKKVLLIDLDYQCNLSISLGIFEEKEYHIYNTIKQKINLLESIVKKEGNLDIIPSNIKLSNFDLDNATACLRGWIMKKSLKNLENYYDYILIDNHPAKNILIFNSLSYSNYILIPIKLAPLGLIGTTQIFNLISYIKNEGLNPDLQILGMLGTFYDNTNEAKKCLKELKKTCNKAGIKIFNTYIRKNIKLAEAVNFGKSIFEYNPKCHGAEDYNNLSKEILEIK